MRKDLHLLSIVLIALVPVCSARAININFDNLQPFNQVGDSYAGQGIHFGDTDAGIQNGLANGDDGNWGLNGTSGPYFDGFNGPYNMTVTVDSPFFGFSMDVSRSEGSSSGDTFTLMGFLGNTLVDSQNITFGDINSWTTLTLSGQMDTIEWTGDGEGFHPYGVDNLNFAAVPEPSSLALACGGLAAFFSRRIIRRRSS